MKVFATSGNDDIARVYLAELSGGRHVEFVESKAPGESREKKWVVIVSTLAGCPVGCPMCDAGSLDYKGPLSADEIFAQIEHVVLSRYPDGRVPAEKFKVQFARVGEPAFNQAVLDVLEALPSRFDAPGLFPALSTIAPEGRDEFFEELLEIKKRLYGGRFQLQFSIHSTDGDVRERLIPIPHWDLQKISEYGQRFYEPGNRKATLNFIAMKGVPLDAGVIADIFTPEHFAIKITPLNPTVSAERETLMNGLDCERPDSFEPASELIERDFDVILSVGELEENRIGSNCGQFIKAHLEGGKPLPDAYTYEALKPGASRGKFMYLRG